MKFLLVNGSIRFPAYLTKKGEGLLERPKNEALCRQLELREAPRPSGDIMAAVEGQYFERYEEAKDYLDSLEEIENA